MTKLRVYWIPQIPCKTFDRPGFPWENLTHATFWIDIDSLEQGVKLLDVLADYDAVQLEHRIKPDYGNAGGIVMLEDGVWVDWYDDKTGEDDPEEYLRRLTLPPEATGL